MTAFRTADTTLPRRRLEGVDYMRELERRFRGVLGSAERATLADHLVPEYITKIDLHAAQRVLDAVGVVSDDELNLRLLALRSVVDAMSGESPARLISEIAIRVAHAAPATEAVVRQRMGVALFFARQALEAEEVSLHALRLCEELGMHRLAARAASVLYGVQYHLTGDLQSANYYAEIATIHATAAGDTAFRQTCMIAQYDLAAVFGDWERAGTLQRFLNHGGRPEAYSGARAAQFADALFLAARGEFGPARGRIAAMLSALSAPPDAALAHALNALCLAAVDVDADARSEARRALALSRASKAPDELAPFVIRRRSAAVLAAYTLVVVGDAYDGRRALTSRARMPGSLGVLAGVLDRDSRGLAIDVNCADLRSVRGYLDIARSVRRVRENRRSLIPLVLQGLTETELAVLRAVAGGSSNAEIALERRVSVNAIERRLMSAYAKLGARNRTEAVARIAKAL